MRQIYLDADFRCHVAPGEGLVPVEVDCFDGRCDTYVCGMRYVPAGQSWTRDDGRVFEGVMLSPTEDTRALDAAQGEYEAAQDIIAELDEALLDATFELLAGGGEML